MDGWKRWVSGGTPPFCSPHLSRLPRPELPALVPGFAHPGAASRSYHWALEDEVKFAASLEGIGQFHNEKCFTDSRMFRSARRVCRVLGVAHNFGLQRQGWVRRWVPRTPSAPLQS